MAVGVQAVHGVAVEGEGGAGFHRAFEHQADHLFYGDGALLDAGVGRAVQVAALPFLAPVILEGVALYGEDVVRAHQVPGGIQVPAGQLPEQVGPAHRGEYVVGLHAVVAVVGAQLQKFRQVLVPGVQVNGHGALPHAQLVHRHGGAVYQLDPADHAAGRALEPADAAPGGTHLAEVKPHAAAEFADPGEVVQAAVDALQAVGHGVDKAAGKLVVGLAGVGEGGGGHGDLQKAEHIVEFFDPGQPVPRFVQGQVQRDAQKHLLRRFQRQVLPGVDHIAAQQKVQPGPGEQFVPLVAEEGRGLFQLGFCIILKNILAV